MKKLIALICMFLVVMLPFSSYNVFAQEKELERAEKTTRAVGEEAKETKLDVRESGEKFEDILIQVDSYQPKVLRAGLLEEQNVYVYASLIGIPTNPTITIPTIKNVDARPINISWKPAGKPAIKISTPRYIRPAEGYLSYRDLGYLAIPINKIPKEHDVPDEITIDMAARISFDITGTLTVGKKDLSMPALKHNEWLSQKDQYSFFAGYLRAEEINENNAVFFLYDNGGTMIPRSFSVSEGATSGVLTTSAFGLAPGLERAFDRFRVRLNKIRGLEDEVVLMIQRPAAETVKLVKGDPLYEGSDWFVQDIKVDKNKEGMVQLIQFANRAGRKPAELLKFEFKDGKLTGEEGTSDLAKREKDFENALAKARLNLFEDPKTHLESYASYANAIATYEKVIQEGNRVIDAKDYEGVYEGGNIAANSQRQIYEIYKELKFVDKQIEAGETLLREYTDVKDRNLIRDELNSLGNKATASGRTRTLPDAGGDITITVLNAFKAGETEKPKATLLVDGGEIEVTIGSTISLDGASFEVVRFDNRVITIKDAKLGAKSIGYNPTTINIEKKEHVLQIKKLDFKRIAHVSVIPEPKQAYSDTNFTLHIPVERRKIGLPLFSSSLEKEINKTAKLIEKLDKYIDQMEKLHKFWTNLCLVTFATIFAKNLLSGVAGMSSGPLIRSKINPEWKQKYSDARASGYKGSFDQYISNNSAEYNADYERTKKILDEIDAKKYNEDPRLAGIKDEEFRRDAFYAYRKAENDPNNEYYGKMVIGNGLRREELKVDGNIEDVQDKDWNSAKSDAQAEEYKKIMDKNLAFSGEYKDDTSRHDKLWNDKQTRADILAVYRRQQVRDAQIKYLDENNDKGYKSDLNSAKITEQERYKDYINSLKRDKPADSKFAIDSVARSDIEKRDGDYYLVGTNTKVEGTPEVGKKVKINGEDVNVVSDEAATRKHVGQLNIYDGGRNKGNVERASLDAYHYAEIEYTTGGRVAGPENIQIWKRSEANGAMGGKDDQRIGNAAAVQAETKDNNLKSSISQLYSCIGGLNNELAKQQVKAGYNVQTSSSVGCGAARYTVSRASQAATGPNCADYMGADDCKLLYNACDPVVCPPSRCNLDGKWQVDNVVQTGIVGSTVLCAPNWVVFGGDVVMPVCLTGILAGLQNIKSVLKAYNQCLTKSKFEDTSVGICDRMRSYFLCDILWREASALLSTKEGVLGLLIDQVSGVGKGGGEYSKGSAAVDEATGAIGYFTESYAKNVFAGYAGAGFSEAGVEICKAAIFGKAPKIGDLLDSVSRPESPLQFTAFFDTTPYSDIDKTPQYLYTTFYYVYAGENEDLTYSVFLRGTPAPGQPVLQPATIAANKRIKAGQFGSENIEKVLAAGYSEICVVTTNKASGTKQECGVGKVTTEFAFDYLNEKYVMSQAQKKISKESECVPDTSSIVGEYKGVGVGAGAAAAVSTGLTQTGIIRTCASESPGIGVDKAAWAKVGTCGKDDIGRDLGSCWLYKPSVDRALQQEYSRDVVEKGLFATSREVEAGGLDKALKAQTLDKEQSIAAIKASRSLDYKEALKELKRVIEKSLDLDIVLIAKYESGNFYKKIAGLRITDIKTGAVHTIIEKESEAEIVGKLLDEYKIATTEKYQMWRLLDRVGYLTYKTIAYSSGADPARGLPVSQVDMSNVKNLEEFMSSLMKEMPGYTYAITDKNIIIKLGEKVDVNALKKAYLESVKREEVMSQLMERIKAASGKTTDFSRAKETADLKVPKDIDLSKVNSLDDFMFEIIGALPGAHQFNVQDNNIIIIKKPPAIIEDIS